MLDNHEPTIHDALHTHTHTYIHTHTHTHTHTPHTHTDTVSVWVGWSGWLGRGDERASARERGRERVAGK